MAAIDFTGWEIDPFSINAEVQAGICSLVLFDPCITLPEDPTDADALAALIAAGEATIICLKNGEKPQGTDVTKTITTCKGERTKVTGRENVFNFQTLWSANNLTSFDEINGKEIPFLFVTSSTNEKPVAKLYPKGTISVDDTFTGNAEDGTVEIVGTLTAKTLLPNLMGTPFDALTAEFLALVACDDTDCGE
jgi:hypothetical protein